MSDQSCGCATQPCDCCEGVQQLTPASVSNRPGLAALSYRVGTQARFLETMKARLSTMTVPGDAADGAAPPELRPLQGLTTREAGDPSIALLDGWATVADVLSFYQERIANEGFLRTATERRSVLELGRLVGYAPRPGVAATVYLAYTVDDNQTDPVVIPAGSRSQSVPGPDQLPQSFETSADLTARSAWNNLQVRLQQPQNLVLDQGATLSANSVLQASQLYLAGTATNLKAGDKLLLVFGGSGPAKVVRTVAAVDAQFTDQRTLVSLQPLSGAALLHLPDLMQFITAVRQAIGGGSDSVAQAVLDTALAIQSEVYLGGAPAPTDWITRIQALPAGDNSVMQKVNAAFETLNQSINKQLIFPIFYLRLIPPETFVDALLVPFVPQVANSLQLQRNLLQSFQTGADTSPQLLVNFVPQIRDSYYAAWANAPVNNAQSQLQGIYALRARGGLFGANAAKIVNPGTTQDKWADWPYNPDETDSNAFLDQANESIAPGSYVLLQSPQKNDDQPPADTGLPRRQVLQVVNVETAPRSQYGISGQSTRLDFGGAWRNVIASDNNEVGSRTVYESITDLRATQVYAQSEALQLAQMPVTGNIGGGDNPQQIELDGLYSELKSGRWVILSGERADIGTSKDDSESVQGVQASELMMIAGIKQGFDSTLPGDQAHTTLLLATPPAYQYKRETLTIYANVVKATHGETRNELLGSGDGTQTLQSFALKQPPLTYVAAPTAAGAQSTLHVYVNNVEWHEVPSLAGLAPTDRKFVTATDDGGVTTLTFGNGIQGSRLPTGVQNVNSAYRNGIGAPGNVDAGQITLLQTRPLGVKTVLNPLRASGGADREGRDLARENTPLSVMPLDRLVSVQDYADFARNFAGIAKAVAQRLSDGQRELLYLTIAGVDDIPIDPSSDLYRNLLQALRDLGDPDLPVRIDLREQVALVLSAAIKLLPDYQWETVAATVRSCLLDRFGFARRALGQPALRCELLSAIQNVPGVAYVDINAFGGVPERSAGDDGSRVLATQQDISRQIQYIVHPESQAQLLIARYVRTPQGLRLVVPPPPGPSEFVYAGAGGVENGGLAPAQLAVFVPSVPDTLILNQIP